MQYQIKILVSVTALLSFTSSLPSRAQDAINELDFALGEPVKLEDPMQTNPWRGFVGAGIIALDHPVAERRAFLVPLASVSYRDTFYLNIGKAGVWLLKSADRRARVGVALKARGGYDPEEIEGLAGMDERDTSAEAGVNAIWRTRPVTVSFGVYTDVSDKSNGNSAQFGLSRPFRLSERWSLIPSLGAEWLSTEVVDYYYGVKPSEAIPNRPAYTGRSSVNIRAALMTHYKLTPAWSLFGGASVTHLGSGITDSPISVEDNVAAIFIGGGWRF